MAVVPTNTPVQLIFVKFWEGTKVYIDGKIEKYQNIGNYSYLIFYKITHPSYGQTAQCTKHEYKF